MLAGEQLAGELLIVHRRFRPQIKATIGALHVHDRREYFQHGIELGAIQLPVGAHVNLVVPGSDARQLGLHGHGAAMIGAVEQEGLEDLGITGDEARTQPRQVRALRQAMEHHAALVIGAAQCCTGGKQPCRWISLVEVQLAVALVGGNDEVVLVGQRDQLF